ncbi:MAG: NAD(P)-dependent oxidoreductase, partial [Bradyrhizobium sp.]
MTSASLVTSAAMAEPRPPSAAIRATVSSAQVAVADLNRASADDTVARIAADGGRGSAIAADVTKEADVIRMIDEA